MRSSAAFDITSTVAPVSYTHLNRLIEILSSKEKDPEVLAEAVAIMEASGSIDYARNYAENLTSIAKNRLVDMVRPSPSRDLLISMADWFVNRLK